MWGGESVGRVPEGWQAGWRGGGGDMGGEGGRG